MRCWIVSNVSSTALAQLAGRVVVVVAWLPQPPGPHASQQLAVRPTQAAPCRGRLQWAASRATRHVVTPAAVVRQQVTKPNLPQVDLAAHLTSARLHCGWSRCAPVRFAASRDTQPT